MSQDGLIILMLRLMAILVVILVAKLVVIPVVIIKVLDEVFQINPTFLIAPSTLRLKLIRVTQSSLNFMRLQVHLTSLLMLIA